MLRKNVILSLIIVSMSGQLSAQNQSATTTPNNTKTNVIANKRLYTGNYLPEVNYRFEQVKNFGRSNVSWNDLKDKKLIILDFWTKYCSSCIAAFPEMERLQREFNENIQIILITPNTREELSSLFKNAPNVKSTTLPMIFGDSLFNYKFFPHSSVPYHVWIDQNNKVVATVDPSETTASQIENFLLGKSPKFSIRNDRIDKSRPTELDDKSHTLLEMEGGRLKNLIIFYSQLPTKVEPNKIPEVKQIFGNGEIPKLKEYSVFMSRDPGADIVLGEDYLLYNKQGQPIGFRIYNSSINRILRTAYSKEIETIDSQLTNPFKHFYIDPSAELYIEKYSDSTNHKRILENHTYSYESRMDTFTIEKACTILKEDIAKCFNIKGKIETRQYIDIVFICKDANKIKKLYADKHDNTEPTTNIRENYIEILNAPWVSLMSTFSINARNETRKVIVTDSCKIDPGQKINLKLPVTSFKLNEDNIQKLTPILSKYGIEIKQKIREADFIVLQSAYLDK